MCKLRLLANLPLYVDNIPIYSPTLREIADIGEDKYGALLTLCSISTDMVKDLSFQIKNNYDALLFVINQSEEALLTFLYALYFFTKIEFAPVLNNEGVVFIKDDYKLNKDNYNTFTNNIKYANCLEVNNIEELDDFDRKVLEAEKKINEKMSNKSAKLNFADLISSVANFNENGLNIINIWDLTIYQFYEQFHRGQLKEQYQWNIKSLLAGADPDNINLETYLQNIK